MRGRDRRKQKEGTRGDTCGRITKQCKGKERQEKKRMKRKVNKKSKLTKENKIKENKSNVMNWRRGITFQIPPRGILPNQINVRLAEFIKTLE